MKEWKGFAVVIVFLFCFSCKKGDTPVTPPVTPPGPLTVVAVYLTNAAFDNTVVGAPVSPAIKIQFSAALLKTSVAGAVTVTDAVAGSAGHSLRYASFAA